MMRLALSPPCTAAVSHPRNVWDAILMLSSIWCETPLRITLQKATAPALKKINRPDRDCSRTLLYASSVFIFSLKNICLLTDHVPSWDMPTSCSHCLLFVVSLGPSTAVLQPMLRTCVRMLVRPPTGEAFLAVGLRCPHSQPGNRRAPRRLAKHQTPGKEDLKAVDCSTCGDAFSIAFAFGRSHDSQTHRIWQALRHPHREAESGNTASLAFVVNLLWEVVELNERIMPAHRSPPPPFLGMFLVRSLRHACASAPGRAPSNDRAALLWKGLVVLFHPLLKKACSGADDVVSAVIRSLRIGSDATQNVSVFAQCVRGFDLFGSATFVPSCFCRMLKYLKLCKELDLCEFVGDLEPLVPQLCGALGVRESLHLWRFLSDGIDAPRECWRVFLTSLWVSIVALDVHADDRVLCNAMRGEPVPLDTDVRAHAWDVIFTSKEAEELKALLPWFALLDATPFDMLRAVVSSDLQDLRSSLRSDHTSLAHFVSHVLRLSNGTSPEGREVLRQLLVLLAKTLEQRCGSSLCTTAECHALIDMLSDLSAVLCTLCGVEQNCESCSEADVAARRAAVSIAETAAGMLASRLGDHEGGQISSASLERLQHSLVLLTTTVVHRWGAVDWHTWARVVGLLQLVLHKRSRDPRERAARYLWALDAPNRNMTAAQRAFCCTWASAIRESCCDALASCAADNSIRRDAHSTRPDAGNVAAHEASGDVCIRYALQLCRWLAVDASIATVSVERLLQPLLGADMSAVDAALQSEGSLRSSLPQCDWAPLENPFLQLEVVLRAVLGLCDALPPVETRADERPREFTAELWAPLVLFSIRQAQACANAESLPACPAIAIAAIMVACGAAGTAAAEVRDVIHGLLRKESALTEAFAHLSLANVADTLSWIQQHQKKTNGAQNVLYTTAAIRLLYAALLMPATQSPASQLVSLLKRCSGIVLFHDENSVAHLRRVSQLLVERLEQVDAAVAGELLEVLLDQEMGDEVQMCHSDLHNQVTQAVSNNASTLRDVCGEALVSRLLAASALLPAGTGIRALLRWTPTAVPSASAEAYLTVCAQEARAASCLELLTMLYYARRASSQPERQKINHCFVRDVVLGEPWLGSLDVRELAGVISCAIHLYQNDYAALCHCVGRILRRWSDIASQTMDDDTRLLVKHMCQCRTLLLDGSCDRRPVADVVPKIEEMASSMLLPPATTDTLASLVSFLQNVRLPPPVWLALERVLLTRVRTAVLAASTVPREEECNMMLSSLECKGLQVPLLWCWVAQRVLAGGADSASVEDRLQLLRTWISGPRPSAQAHNDAHLLIQATAQQKHHAHDSVPEETLNAFCDALVSLAVSRAEQRNVSTRCNTVRLEVVKCLLGGESPWAVMPAARSVALTLLQGMLSSNSKSSGASLSASECSDVLYFVSRLRAWNALDSPEIEWGLLQEAYLSGDVHSKMVIFRALSNTIRRPPAALEEESLGADELLSASEFSGACDKKTDDSSAQARLLVTIAQDIYSTTFSSICVDDYDLLLGGISSAWMMDDASLGALLETLLLEVVIPRIVSEARGDASFKPHIAVRAMQTLALVFGRGISSTDIQFHQVLVKDGEQVRASAQAAYQALLHVLAGRCGGALSDNAARQTLRIDAGQAVAILKSCIQMDCMPPFSLVAQIEDRLDRCTHQRPSLALLSEILEVGMAFGFGYGSRWLTNVLKYLRDEYFSDGLPVLLRHCQEEHSRSTAGSRSSARRNGLRLQNRAVRAYMHGVAQFPGNVTPTMREEVKRAFSR